MNERSFLWSVRREIWENRSLYIAPLVVAAFVLLGFVMSPTHLARQTRAAGALDPVKKQELVMMPYNIVAGLVIVTAFLVGIFYCLDALHGERRDRSILFWKSLPVSDRTAVLAKASIPLVILPLTVFATVVATQFIMLLISTFTLIWRPANLATLWANVRPFQLAFAFLYALICIALWHAPIYAWLLVISAWAKRAALLWALLPLLAIMAFEKGAFNTTHVAHLVGYRVVGWFKLAFEMAPQGKNATEPLTHLTPGHFLSTPGLWIGLLIAAAFIALAIRLRRDREPI